MMQNSFSLNGLSSAISTSIASVSNISAFSSLLSDNRISNHPVKRKLDYSDINFNNIQGYLSEVGQYDDTSRPGKVEAGGRKSTSTRRPRPTRATKATRRSTKRPRTTTSASKPATTPPPTTTEDYAKPIDTVWILLCGIIIFTIQTGFGLLEAGIVSIKNETNIMLKNIADVICGGFTYWIFGYGITYGTWRGSSSVFGFGLYAVDAEIEGMGDLFSSFFFQLSFATTATTIVSGAVAERCNYKAYCLYSLIATVTYCVAARWVWGPSGWLQVLGAIDIAGSGVVHLTGGAAAFVSAWFIGPRLGRFETGPPPWGNPTNAYVGTLTLWWGWIAFNAGSTYGVTQDLWKFAARACATTMVAGIAGGMVGMLWAFIKPGKFFDPDIPINAILGALVGVTAGCAIYHTPEAFGVGAIGALLVIFGGKLIELMKIDDPVGASAVHGIGGIWGLLAVGFFAEDDEGILGVTKERSGLFRVGGWYLLGVQTLMAVTLAVWSMVSTFVIFFFINIIIPLRVTAEEELLGLDLTEHGIRRRGIGVTPTISLFQSTTEVREIQDNIVADTGKNNPGHEKMVELLRDARVGSNQNKPRFKIAAQFARAFNKLRAKGRRISSRDRQYILNEYKSPLKSSLESFGDNRFTNNNNAVTKTDSANLQPDAKIEKISMSANVIPTEIRSNQRSARLVKSDPPRLEISKNSQVVYAIDVEEGNEISKRNVHSRTNGFIYLP